MADNNNNPNPGDFSIEFEYRVGNYAIFLSTENMISADHDFNFQSHAYFPNGLGWRLNLQNPAGGPTAAVFQLLRGADHAHPRLFYKIEIGVQNQDGVVSQLAYINPEDPELTQAPRYSAEGNVREKGNGSTESFYLPDIHTDPHVVRNDGFAYFKVAVRLFIRADDQVPAPGPQQ